MGFWKAAAGTGLGPLSFMEPLEPRALLAAVTATVNSAITNASSFFIEVKYSSDSPIDASTVAGDELRVFRTEGGFDVTPAFERISSIIGGNTLVAKYRVEAPANGGLWTIADNGHYLLQFRGGTVRNNEGETNAPADVRTFSLWFSAAGLSVANNAPLDVYGTGYTGLPDGSGRVSTADEARIDVKYELGTLTGIMQKSIVVHLTGPNGYDQSVTMAMPSAAFSPRAGGGYVAVIPVRFAVPGTTWDPSDSGRYTLTVRFEETSPTIRIVKGYDVAARGVKAEIAGVSVTTGEMLVTMKYSHPSGINLSSITPGDVKVTIPGLNTYSPTLVGAPVVVDGVVTAVYRLAEPQGGWAAVSGGHVTVRTGLSEVRSTNGEVAGYGTTRTVSVASGGRVVGTVKSAYSTPTTLVVVMRYSSDRPIDQSTLGDDDLRLTGPGGYNQLADLVQVVPQANGEVLAVYHFRPDGGLLTWDFRVDNGRYDLSIIPDAVRELNGDTVVDGVVRYFGLFFQTPAVELITPAQIVVGSGVNGLFDGVDAASIVMRYTTYEPRTFHNSNFNLTARLSGPNGFVSTQVLPRYTFTPYRSMDYGNETEVELRIAAPGGEWDAADNGVYTMTVLYNNGSYSHPSMEAVFSQQFTVNAAGGPRVELVSKVFTATTMAVTVRYDSPGGVNLGSIGTNDLVLSLRSAHFLFGWEGQEIVGTLVGTPVAGAGGSYTVTYCFLSPSGQPWYMNSRALLTVRPNEVSDGAGRFMNGALVEYFQMQTAQPDLVGVSTVSTLSTGWTVEVSLRNLYGVLVPNSIQEASLVVAAPGGRTTRVAVDSVVTGPDGVARVRYRIMPPTGESLVNGTYTLSLASESISMGAAGYLPGMALGTFNNLVFA